MQGMLFLGDKQVALRAFPTPSGPSGRQVVVKMRASGLCGSDLTPYRAVPGDLGTRAHVIGGHEPCGDVVEIGPDARNVRVGDRVMVYHYSGCGTCAQCLTGWWHMCTRGEVSLRRSGPRGLRRLPARGGLHVCPHAGRPQL